MHDDIPQDYEVVWREFVVARDQSIRPGQNEQERQQSNAAFDAALERLEANSHWRWLQEIRQDEIAAQEIALSQAAMSPSFALEHQIWDEIQHNRYSALCRLWNEATDDERRRFLDNFGVTWDP